MPDAPVQFPAGLDPYRARLREMFGYPDFRDGQAEVLEALAQGDVVGVMPTGSGKSACFVLPALEVGRTLVVSPLIALMRDQVTNLGRANVEAAFINSSLDRAEKNARYLAFVRGELPLLYLAPEGLRNARLIAGLRRHGVNLLAIDEAHCISQWGHDFRPDYLLLGALREQLGNPRVLALTATADARVRKDIAVRLGIDGAAREVVTSFDRPNLDLSVERHRGVRSRIERTIEIVREHDGGSGIVYVRTRRRTEEIAERLREEGVAAEAYHAGLGRDLRSNVQGRFDRGETPVIVATTAFGMGVDKPDVRFVLHFNMPGRLESYYQEAGRAGRDGEPAACVLLYDRRDRQAQQWFIDEAHPDDARVRTIWRDLLDREDDQPLDDDQTNNALEALRASGPRRADGTPPALARPRGPHRHTHDHHASRARGVAARPDGGVRRDARLPSPADPGVLRGRGADDLRPLRQLHAIPRLARAPGSDAARGMGSPGRRPGGSAPGAAAGLEAREGAGGRRPRLRRLQRPHAGGHRRATSAEHRRRPGAWAGPRSSGTGQNCSSC